jgi:Baseplate J-like protein
MADEQIIYISPEEELTNVRERLEHTAAKRIILVIPPQTQLRSHVGWRLLHARTREMGKDVVIISSDRQIRAVAKAAGFRVADSLESPSTNKSRPASRPARNVGGGKTPSRPRSLFGKGMPENRSTIQPAASPRGYVPSNDRPLTQLSPQPPQTPQTYKETGSTISRADEMTSEAGSSTFGSRDNPYGQDFEHRIDTAPSIHPLSPPFEDEEPDLLIEDFNQAQNIRQAAQVGDADAARTEPEHPVPPVSAPSSYGSTSIPHDLDDPYAYREDFQPTSLPEQHGSISMDELDTDAPDIGDVPTSIIVDGDIEDLGDEGDIVDPYSSSPRSWGAPVMEEPARAEPPRVYGMRPRNSRAGNMPRPPYEDSEDEDTLMPPEQQAGQAQGPYPSTQPPPVPTFRTTPARVMGVPPSTVGNRPPQPIITPQARTIPGYPPPGQGTPAARPVPAIAKQPPASSRSRAVPPLTTRRPPAGRRNARGIAFILTTIILIVLVFGILLILIPSADISVTLPSQSFTTPVKVTATSTSRQDANLHTVPAQQLVFTGKVGPLNGTTQVGGKATGYVTFTNSGLQPLTVPTNTIVATKSGAQFLTQGEAVVQPGNPFLADPIIAQNAGTIGNVVANTITVIPPDSINAIAQANNISPTGVSLTVFNPSATTGGKPGSTSNGTTNDKNALMQMLHQQMQNQFKSWLKGQLHAQDVAGKPTPDIQSSPNPLQQESFAIGTPAADGSFSGTDSLQATVLVVRTADLQAAAAAELNAAASKEHPGYILISPSSLTLGKISSTPSKDGKSLTISFTPKGLVGQNVQLDNLRSQLAGRKVDDAQKFLKSNASGLKGVINSQVTLFPGFFSNIPFWTARINIHVQYH